MGIWLRATRYQDDSAVTFVAAPEDLSGDIHQVANDTRQKFGDMVDVEIFEFDGTLEEAVVEAKKRSLARLSSQDRFYGALHDYLIATFMVTPKQVVITPSKPVPLDAATVKEIMLAVMQHPGYKGQIVLLRTSDGKEATLRENRIIIRDNPS